MTPARTVGTPRAARPDGAPGGPDQPAGPDGPVLDADAADRLRDAVTEAVLSASPGLRERIAEDPAASLALVLASRTAAEQTSRLLQEAVTAARGAGHSWDTVGRLLGVSRQAAQQRFGVPGPPAGAGPDRRVLTPLTAFDEMGVLEREGRRGWHLVDFGPLYHVVEASGTVWEHRRALWSPAAARRLAAGGWLPVGPVTFPWGYWKRPTGEPVEMG
ncbi:hypothetical protein [Aquipuribacter hungaricus]|uniref:Uncharacterized protein n=2 Tax=Aquipuribacter hungaricus TaxID=545624 RepID=A0ABV7WF39_9MICO